MISPQEASPNLSRPDVNLVVEKMSPVRKNCAEMILTSVSNGKLVRRYTDPVSDLFWTEEEEGRFPMLTIARDLEHEFVGAANLADLQNPNIPLLLYFINLRGGTKENYKTMAEAIADKGIPFEYDGITGIPTTGPNIGEELADMTGKPYYYILAKAGKGTDRKFELVSFMMNVSKPEKGQRILIVDDLITKKQTKDDAEKFMISAGIEVAGHAVVVDREEGGFADMTDEGRQIVAALTATELFAVGYQKGIVTDEVYETLMRNIKNINNKRLLERMKKKIVLPSYYESDGGVI
jgi:orotate phosphoribosyltransferase